MPIGKNSLKRVANNGYSNVKTEAPDMENSSVIANPAPQVVEMLEKEIAQVKAEKKTAAKKPAAKKPCAKAEATVSTAKKSSAKAEKPTAKAEAAVSTAKKSGAKAEKPTAKAAEKTNISPEKETAKDGFAYVNLGGELPYYLL